MDEWLVTHLSELDRRGLRRFRRAVSTGAGPTVRLTGHDLINFASNDYLGLSADVRLARAAARTAQRYGTGAGASPLIVGHSPPLRRLERRLAEWENAPAALVFSSGYLANLATVTALAGDDDAIFSDELNHASLIDGCRLSRAEVRVYRHNDADHLAELLRSSRHRRRWVVTDSVFSMDGDIAPLATLLGLCREFDATLIIDEAHATGVLGRNGSGLVAELAAAWGWDRLVKVGTLSKALGSQGGFVCGSESLVGYLVNTARPYIFSTALAPPCAAAAAEAVRIAVAEPERRHILVELAGTLRSGLYAAGWPVTNSVTQVVPVVIGDAGAAVDLSTRLQERGYLVPAVRPPAVPEGASRLRISVTAAHTSDHIAGLLQALREDAPGNASLKRR